MSRLEGTRGVLAMMESDGQQDLVRPGCAHVQGVPLISVEGDEARATNYSRVFRYTDPGYEVWRVSANKWKSGVRPTGGGARAEGNGD